MITRIGENLEELKKDPQNINEWIMLGVNRKSISDYEGARDAWEYAKALNPTNIVPWNNLGDLYHFYLKDYVKSEENWKKTIALKPDYIQGYSGLIDLYRYSFKVKLSETPVILKQGITKNPDAIDLQVMLAHYYQDAAMTTEAKDAYNKAIITAERLKNPTLTNLLKSELSGIK
jgi:Tfp pilus assembly protein PilF